MADTQSAQELKAAKDKSCKYCHQIFTSSSLGRHLDLYVKEKNPKAPDGIHDVDEIRRLRNTITRRTPKTANRRDTTASSTPGPDSYRTTGQDDLEEPQSAISPRMRTFNDLGFNSDPLPAQPGKLEDGAMDSIQEQVLDVMASTAMESSRGVSSKAQAQRISNRNTQKTQLDTRHKIQEMFDRAKATELALRELVTSLRAAKQRVDLKNGPFAFDPLSLDFPALVLQCLSPPPTLFCSTQLTTPTSWSILPPNEIQRDALTVHFTEAFQQYQVSCMSATNHVMEESPYPSSQPAYKEMNINASLQASKSAKQLEQQVHVHVEKNFRHWQTLPLARRHEVWVLELARGLGRRNEDLEKLRQETSALKQENANLKLQMEQTNRQTQPKEFKLRAPSNIPMDEKLIQQWCKDLFDNPHGIGLSPEYRHLDLNTVVQNMVSPWKSLVTENRSKNGLASQKTLDASLLGTAGTQIATSTSSISPSASDLPSPEHKHSHQVQTQTPRESLLLPPVTQVLSKHNVSVRTSDSQANVPIIPMVDDDNDDEEDEADADAEGEMQVNADMMATYTIPRAGRLIAGGGGVAKSVRMKHPQAYVKSQAKTASAVVPTHAPPVLATASNYRRASHNGFETNNMYTHTHPQLRVVVPQGFPGNLGGSISNNNNNNNNNNQFSPNAMMAAQQIGMHQQHHHHQQQQQQQHQPQQQQLPQSAGLMPPNFLGLDLAMHGDPMLTGD